MQVPTIIKTVFDSAPLVTYPGSPESSPAQIAELERQKYYFGSTSSSSSASSFILAVHNVIKVQLKFCPTDPLSFAHCLAICVKNNLKLPTGEYTNGNSLLPVLYHASPDHQLPFLIEDNQANKFPTEEGVRTLRSTMELDASFASKLSESPLSVAVNTLVDTLFYDIWVAALLVDAQEESLHQIFQLKSTLSLTNRLYITQLLRDIPAWRDFHTKNESLFAEYPTLGKGKNTAIELFYYAQIQKLLSLEPQLHSYMDSDKLISLKITAFYVAIDQTLQGTKLHEAVQGELLERSYQVLEEF